MIPLTGILLGIGFIFPYLWWLSILGVMLLLQFVVTHTLKTACFGAFSMWCIKASCSLLWLGSSYPLDWLHIPSVTAQVGLISFYWLSASLWLGGGGVLFALGVRFLYTKTFIPHLIFYAVVPFLWLTSELVSAAVFSLFALGPGSFIQSYFSFGQLGYLLGVTQLGLYLAGFGGVYGLTLVIASLGTIFWYVVLQKLYKVSRALVISTVALVIIFSYQYHPVYQSKNITVQSINTEFSSVMLGLPGGFEEKTAVLQRALTESLLQPADYVLLPEDSRYFSSVFGDISPVALASRFEFAQGNTDTIVIDSSRLDLVDGQTVLRAQVYDGKAKVVYQFDKQYLVPQGEYVPHLYGSILRALGFGPAVDAISLDSSYRPGPLLQNDTMPSYLPGILFCFESVRPTGVTSLVENRALPFVAHPISHGWFHTPKLLWQQLDVMLAIQARFSGVPIVSAGNMATGKLYLPNGVIELGKVVRKEKLYQLQEFNF